MTTTKPAAEKAITIASKLYEARDFMRRMSGDKYAARMADYQGYIRAGMEKYQLDALETTLKLARAVQSTPFVQACIFAAYVEMTEQKNRPDPDI